ncbi:MAG: gluconokinase [Christensenellales bacterium]|jgi:gluconokinase
MAVLVLEASTSSAKAMVYDQDKGIVNIYTEAYAPQISDVATHDADGVFAAMMAAGQKACEGREIDAVSLGGTWHSLVMLGGAMRPITRAMTWAYTGAATTAGSLRRDSKLTAEIYSRTGCMVHTIYPAFKYMHLLSDGAVPDGQRIAGEGDYFYYLLTGQWHSSHSMASGTAFLNTHNLDYDEQMLELARVKRDNLPQLVSHEQCAPLSRQMADRLGLPPGIPVVPPHPDGALNQVGAGALAPGLMTLSVGTSGALRMAFDRPVMPSEPGGTWCYVAPGKWLCGAATSGATNCVDWFVQTLLNKQFTFDELEQMASQVKGDYPIFTPFLYGERCPGWRDDALGSFSDISGAYGPGHLYKSLLEGILMNIYHCYTLLGEVGGFPRQIRVSGGILHSRFWTQMLADILGQQIACADMAQASMMGGAALALHAAGHLPDLMAFDAGEHQMVAPNGEMAGHYALRFARYLASYQNHNQTAANQHKGADK